MTLSDAQLATLATAPLRRLLSIAGNMTARQWTRVMADQHGLSAAGAAILVLLAAGHDGDFPTDRQGRATHGDLARRSWIRPATLTGIVDTLVRGGLVERVRDDADRRIVWITLTPLGRERAGQIYGDLQKAFVRTRVEDDPVKAAIVREYLTELITTYHAEETRDG